MPGGPEWALRPMLASGERSYGRAMTTALHLATPARRPLAGRLPAVAGIGGPVLFTLAFVVQGLLRPEHDTFALPVSALEAGTHGWVQQVNFAVLGCSLLLLAAGLHRHMARTRLNWLPSALLAVSGLGLWWAAAFPLRLGADGEIYDPGGHIVGGFVFFLGSALALLALARKMTADPAWRSLGGYTLAVGVAALAGFFVTGLFVMPDGAPGHPVAGLAQRALIVLVTFPCLVTTGLRLYRLTGAPVTPAA